MKIVTYSKNGSDLRLGILLDEKTIIDPQQAYVEKLNANGQLRSEEIAKALLPEDPTEFLANGEVAFTKAEEAIEYGTAAKNTSSIYKIEDVYIGAPILNPKKIICVGLNYHDHIKEMNREVPKHPVIFAKFATAITGPNDDFPLSEELTKKLDYEAEFAFVIGKRGKNISQEDALDYVAGYTVVNDITARDMQKRTIQWLQGKTLDKSLPMGPYLATKDEVPNIDNAAITSKINGEIRQQSNINQLVFTVPYLVEFLSHIMTLEPGDIICTGTPGGVGEAQNKFLKAGDVVRVEIEGIGAIENKIVKELVKETVN
ncbi:fumarylacetoacetate hydrolase family protein [Bacillus sp. OK048]|uniref:fumarylacetoacetate hydrolase family protein n=1 Tax=Bacillus sp. OK048 TaxID=1882761 RepID=UPI000888B209|nr:fumarylacetoacetate hydrolase family protein [Bacillus sp. OK048]SDM48019.1 acylpyruvate hydrolase [Bacillus sp. OK048]